MDNTLKRMTSASGQQSLEEELSATRSSLRRQTIRCHQIISALMKKMQEKETEAHREKELRDRQLSGVLRSLYNLEARLRREQRAIRQQLQEKDTIISSQQREIEELRKAAEIAAAASLQQQHQHRSVQSQTMSDKMDGVTDKITTDLSEMEKMMESKKMLMESKPDLITSIIDIASTKKDGSAYEDVINEDQRMRKHRVTFDTDCTYFSNDWSNMSSSDNILDNFDAYEFNQNSLESFSTDAPSSKNSDSDIDFKNEINGFDLIQSNVDNDFGSESMSSSNESSPDRTVVHNPKISETLAAYKINQSPSTLIQEIKIGSDSDKHSEYYQNNPVLKCVSQILLRDEEDYLEEQRNLQLKEDQKLMDQDAQKMNQDTDKICNQVPLDKTSLSFESSFKTSPTMPAFKSPKDDEKFFYPLQSKLFTPPKIMSNNKNSTAKNLPPALPPKPQCLLKSKPKVSFNTSISTNPFMTSPELEMKQQLAQPIRIVNNERISSVLQAIQDDNSPFPKPPSPNDELYVISNSALSGNDDDDDLMTSRSSLFNSHQDQQDMEDLKKCLNFASPQYQLLSNMKNGESTPSNNILNLLPNNLYHVTDTKNDDTLTSVSQMVKKFENIGSKPVHNQSKMKDGGSGDSSVDSNESLKENFDLSQNFEEFCLEDCDIESVDSSKSTSDGSHSTSRIEAEGAAEVMLGNLASSDESVTVSYENFLEATGLSQKSIMTPSRMFSNHKHVLKPKDVKHRNKVKATSNVGIFQRCAAATSISGGPTIKYWTEPFL